MDWESAPELLKDASMMAPLNGHHPWLDDLPSEAQRRLDNVLARKLERAVNGSHKKKVIEYPFLCEYEGCFVILESGHHRGQHYRRHEEGRYGVPKLRTQ
jgi:hypothetical protein